MADSNKTQLAEWLAAISRGCRQAIETRFLGPTTTRRQRVKATAQAGSATIEWNSALSREENHIVAALMLAHKMGWIVYAGPLDDAGLIDALASFHREWRMGSLASGNGYVFVER